MEFVILIILRMHIIIYHAKRNQHGHMRWTCDHIVNDSEITEKERNQSDQHEYVEKNNIVDKIQSQDFLCICL